MQRLWSENIPCQLVLVQVSIIILRLLVFIQSRGRLYQCQPITVFLYIWMVRDYSMHVWYMIARQAMFWMGSLLPLCACRKVEFLFCFDIGKKTTHTLVVDLCYHGNTQGRLYQ